jgi:hypothetical protein
LANLAADQRASKNGLNLAQNLHTDAADFGFEMASKNVEADPAFLRGVLKFTHVDVGDCWLTFGLPPAEVAVHSGKNDVHEFYLMCDDLPASSKD